MNTLHSSQTWKIKVMKHLEYLACMISVPSFDLAFFKVSCTSCMLNFLCMFSCHVSSIKYCCNYTCSDLVSLVITIFIYAYFY